MGRIGRDALLCVRSSEGIGSLYDPGACCEVIPTIE